MLYLAVSILLLILSLLIIIYTCYLKKNKIYYNFVFLDKTAKFLTKNSKYVFIVLFLINILVSTYSVSTLPYGLHVDEAGMAYDAYLLANFGVDRYSNFLPVYLINFGGGQSALYAYLAAIFIKIFGYSTFIIRLPAILVNVVTFYVIYLCTKENKKISMVLLLLYTIVPYYILQSRWGLDCNLLVGFLTMSVLIFYKYLCNRKKILLIISGIFFGITLYTYALSYIILPLFLIFTIIYLLYIKKINFKEIFVLGIPIFLISFPLILMILLNNGFIDDVNFVCTIPILPDYRGSEISLWNIFDNLYIFLSIFSYDNPNIFGERISYNSITNFGTIYYMAIPFCIIGFKKVLQNFIKSCKNNIFSLDIFILFWFIAVITTQLLIVEPNINKANAVFFPLIYFVSIGIISLCKNQKIVFTIIISFFILNFVFFSSYYINDYNDEHNNLSLVATNYLDVIEYTLTENNNTFYFQTSLTQQQYIYVLLLNEVEPSGYNKSIIYGLNDNIYYMSLPDEININSTYIISNDNEEFITKIEDYNYTKIEFGEINIYIID